MKTVRYGGIADALGIESFIPIKDMSWSMELRVESNRHRHAVIYEIECTQDFADELNKVLGGIPDNQGNTWNENKRYEIALKKIKGNYANQNGTVTEIDIDKKYQNSWEMIPNKKLDPYAS